MSASISFVHIPLCIITTFVILFLYKRKKIDVVGALLWGFATRTFNIESIGPTIDPLFFVSFYLVFEEIFIYYKLPKFSAKYGLLFLLPVFTYLFVFVYNNFDFRFFNINPSDSLKFFSRPLYFYIKTYIVFFVLASKIYRTSSSYEINVIYSVIRKIVIFSLVIAILQLFFVITFNNETINSILGLDNGGVKYSYSLFGFNLVRVQALFYEPKGFAAFLGLSLPIVFKDRKFILIAIVLFIGFLTLSVTFLAFILVGIVSFIFLTRIKNVRTQIMGNIIVIIILFIGFSFFSKLFFENYLAINNQQVSTIISKRLENRFDYNYGENEFLGMPLQGDLEMPVLNFLKDNPILILTGYGPANNIFIPPNYFFGQANYDSRIKRTIEGHIDMGWYYYIAEFGLIYFVFLLFILSNLKFNGMDKNYYAFLWGGLFFTRIDLIVLIFFVVLLKRNNFINGVL